MDPFTGPLKDTLFQYAWTQSRQNQPPGDALHSPLLALHMSSDVDPILSAQVADARQVLRLRHALLCPDVSVDAASQDEPAGATSEVVLDLQRRVVERFLAGRRAYFGPDECQPLPDTAQLMREGRDVFLVVKFMDEAPHIAATMHSLLNQRGIDMRRVVIVAVDNNSTDGSDRIVRRIMASNRSAAALLYLNQTKPGAGNAARLGVDRCITTIHRMCELDGDWSRLQTAVIAVSDGDTVYHPFVVHETVRLLEEHPAVDGVMPFLTYKLTAALRLFVDYLPAMPEVLVEHADLKRATPTDVDLSSSTAFDQLPRRARRRIDSDRMLLRTADGRRLTVQLASTDIHGRRFGTLQDRSGRLGFVMEDRTLVLAEAPLSGDDASLVFLENGGVRKEEKWRWHAVIGHDIFLRWLFDRVGLSEQVVYPDTSDALKTFRAWAFAIGGQHQLRRPGLRIVTGSDYQSGRILQAMGCTVCLGPAHAYAETEIDRLIKMVRNLAQGHSVFYGATRGSALERASGLYVHMTRIQDDIEAEVRDYDEAVFEHRVFPERVLFPLRWILQNALRFYAQHEAEAQSMVRDLLSVMFAGRAEAVEQLWFQSNLQAIRHAAADDRLDLAERIAEEIIATNYQDLMRLYRRTLRNYFVTQRVPRRAFRWLLADVELSRNPALERPPEVDPAAVWAGSEFVIDIDRGQVVQMASDRQHDPTPVSETAAVTT